MTEFDLARPEPFHVARDPVNLPVIRRWCDAMGDRNPVHLDARVAARSRFGQVVAPLAMLDVWTNPGLAYERDLSDPRGAAYEMLDRDGFTSAVAVSSELVQDRPLLLGDDLRSTVMLEAVSPEKSTALGVGHFVTTRLDFFVVGAPVGRSRFSVFKFRPTGDPRQASTASTPPSRDEDAAGDVRLACDALGTVLARSLQVGERLPTRSVPLTTTLVVSGALMTSDYFDAHHDRDAAVRRGSKDVFMNIHTTLGLVEAWASGWLGPNALWHAMSARLGTPNHPGDVMTLRGQVAAVDSTSGQVTIDFRATNSLGLHTQGSIDVEVPTA